MKVISNWRLGRYYLHVLELLSENKRADVAKELGISENTLTKLIFRIRLFSMRADFFCHTRDRLIRRSAFIGGLLAPQQPEEVEELEEEF